MRVFTHSALLPFSCKKGFEGSRIQGFKCLFSNDFIYKCCDTIDMISIKSLKPCSFFAFHSNPRPLGPLNPGEDSNFFGDEPHILTRFCRVCWHLRARLFNRGRCFARVLASIRFAIPLGMWLRNAEMPRLSPRNP